MKITKLFFLLYLCPLWSAAQFSTSASSWPTPVGGSVLNNLRWGYNATGGAASGTFDPGSESWAVLDINGDHLPDLVVTAQSSGGTAIQYSASSNPYWKVYLNTGSGFSTSATSWATPVGGSVQTNTRWGYNALGGAAASSLDPGSESWTVLDINGDNMPDLVVTAQGSGGAALQYSASSNPYWKVYLNTGSGFSTSAISWATPVGGSVLNNLRWGYNATGGAATGTFDPGSESWAVADLNGDGKPDLAVTAQGSGGLALQYSASSSPYWKVYLNTGSGFSTSATSWATPVGGSVQTNTRWGYNALGGTASSSLDPGSESWAVLDLNGDNKPDLVVTAQGSGGAALQYSASSNPYWKVYLNTGSGFSTSATSWATPVGGSVLSNTRRGYNATGGAAGSTFDPGSESWTVADLDGDGKPDLVVTAQGSGGVALQYSASSSPYWKVYRNTGSGFSTSATSWATPVGGSVQTNTRWGYNALGGTAISSLDPGSQSWTVLDLNGDGKPDLAVTAQGDGSGRPLEYSASSSPYWKVYMNTTTTAISTVEESSEVVLYPNPNTGNFTLGFADGQARTIEISELTGRKIYSSALYEKQNTIHLHLPDAAPGIYILHIHQQGATKAIKFVITK